jgi:hypothetical protein
MNSVAVKELVTDVLTNSTIYSESPQGGSAVYIKLINNIGVKLFYDKNQRDISKKRMEAYPDLSPLIYGEFDLPEKFYHNYALVMENAETLKYNRNDDAYYTLGKRYDIKKARTLVKQVVADMERNNLSFFDDHTQNIGFLKRLNKWVCIDWEPDSVELDEEFFTEEEMIKLGEDIEIL